MEQNNENKSLVDKLPEEVLVEIFSCLDSEDLHKLAEVRSDWKKLISNNARTRKKLTLQLDYRSRGPQRLQNADFRYSKIEILYCNKEAGHWNGALSAMRKFSNDLRHLILTDCHLSYNQNLVEVFRFLGKLEVFDLSRVQTDSTIEDIQANKFDNLKKIFIDGSSWHVLKFIGLSQVKCLDISSFNRHLTSSDMMKDFIEFLCAQTKLEELKLTYINFSNVIIEPEDIEKMNFPLKRLTLDGLTNFIGGEENALAFLERFANTLEELELRGHFETSFYSLVFGKLQKLQSLELNARCLPENENFYETLPNLSSVKTLVIWGLRDQHRPGVQGVIGHLPNIETLIFRSWTPSNELMTSVSNNLLKLKSLDIYELAGNAFEGVRVFENLLKLDVESMEEASEQNWSEMLAAMPNIEQFTLRYCSKLNSAKFDAMTRSWPQLRVLNLGRSFVPEAPMFIDLLIRCPNITTVRVHCEAVHPAFEDFKKPGLRLIARDYLEFERLEVEKDPTSLNY